MAFYKILVLLSVLCLRVFAESINGPALSFQPTPPVIPAIDGSENILLWYNSSNLDSIKELTNKISAFLNAYKTATSTSADVSDNLNCDYNHPPPKGKSCSIGIREFAPCVEENHFNYHKSAPCIFFRMENTAGWIPEYYNNSQSLPENMPEFLRQYIKEVEQTHKEKLNTIWLTCEGASPVDRELTGPIQYKQQFGFPGYYFQQEISENYQSPLVAVLFERPMRGIIMKVECRLWARNIKQDANTKVGFAQFELLVD